MLAHLVHLFWRHGWPEHHLRLELASAVCHVFVGFQVIFWFIIWSLFAMDAVCWLHVSLCFLYVLKHIYAVVFILISDAAVRLLSKNVAWWPATQGKSLSLGSIFLFNG